VQSAEGSTNVQPEAPSTADVKPTVPQAVLDRIDAIKRPGPLQISNMRGAHLAQILILTWLGCFLTVGLALFFGWRWGYGAGVVDGQREAKVQQEQLHTTLAAAIASQPTPVVSLPREPVPSPSVSTFVVMLDPKTKEPQIIRVKGEAVKLPKEMAVTVKNIRELLPAAPEPAPAPAPVPEPAPEPKKAEKKEVKPDPKDPWLPPPGKATEDWLKKHGNK